MNGMAYILQDIIEVIIVVPIEQYQIIRRHAMIFG